MFWCRHVDDTFVIQKEIHKQDFLQHINCIDPTIQFTVEDNKEDRAIPFLDTIVKPEADGKLSTNAYRKPTHTDQWDSHHHLSAKFSVIHTFSHRVQIVCSNPELLHKEKTYLRNALTHANTPYGLWTRWREGSTNLPVGTTSTQTAAKEVKTKGHIVIPYTQGLCECIKKICGRYGMQTYFKGSNTIRSSLVPPRTKPYGQQKWGLLLVPMW